MSGDIIEEKLRTSEEYATRDGAELTTSFMRRIKARYDEEVHDDRVTILYDLAVQEFNNTNISKYAVERVAKESKIHYFLYGNREKMVKDVIRRFH